jgi:hypothetical protein
VSINEERLRDLLRSLEKEDPDADVRMQLIAGQPPDDSPRTRAVSLLATLLVRDPSDLMSAPPVWLVDLSRTAQAGTTLLFDSRLRDLAQRAVDDLLSQGCDVDRLLHWLEGARRVASPGPTTRSEAAEG